MTVVLYHSSFVGACLDGSAAAQSLLNFGILRNWSDTAVSGPVFVSILISISILSLLLRSLLSFKLLCLASLDFERFDSNWASQLRMSLCRLGV